MLTQKYFTKPGEFGKAFACNKKKQVKPKILQFLPLFELYLNLHLAFIEASTIVLLQNAVNGNRT